GSDHPSSLATAPVGGLTGTWQALRGVTSFFTCPFMVHSLSYGLHDKLAGVRTHTRGGHRNERLGDSMLMRYMRVCEADGLQKVALQRDALMAAGIDPAQIYEDQASGRLDARPGLAALLKALRAGDTLVVWKLDRLGRDLRHLVNTVHDLTQRGVGFKVLTGHGASIDTTSPSGKLVFGIFAALAEFQRGLSVERSKAGMGAPPGRGMN